MSVLSPLSDFPLIPSSSLVYLGMSFEDFQLQDQDDSSLDLQGIENQQFAIFVSFAEIYNEFIYDLLVETPARGRHRPVLKISQDKHQNYYIKGNSETWTPRTKFQSRHCVRY
jgi:kinesin family protein 20